MKRRRLRPTFVLRVLVLVSSLAICAGLARVVLRDAPLWLLAVCLIAWIVALELYLLPEFQQRWAVKWVEGRAPSARLFRLLVYDAQAVADRQRDDRRAEVHDNPSLW